MPIEAFHRLPRHPDWRHEYHGGALQLSHRPKPILLRRPVELPVAGSPVAARIGGQADLDAVRAFLADVWRHEEPYCCAPDDGLAAEWLDDDLERSVAREGLRVAVAEAEGALVGAVLVESLRMGLGDGPSPTLTWLTVRRRARGTGVADALLAAVVDSLRADGVSELASAVSAANRASIVWHWRNGFVPLEQRERR